jgi:hypothetical protein
VLLDDLAQHHESSAIGCVHGEPTISLNRRANPAWTMVRVGPPVASSNRDPRCPGRTQAASVRGGHLSQSVRRLDFGRARR